MTNFDERARDWDSDPKKVERAKAVAEAIRNAVPLSNGMSILEWRTIQSKIIKPLSFTRIID